MTARSGELEDLLFDVRRSARYHDCRVAHFQMLQRMTNVSTILLSGVVIMDLFGAEIIRPIKIVAALTAVFGAFDLVIGFGKCADVHRDLKRRFLALERKSLGLTGESPQRGTLERLEIEAEEPPAYRALDTMCHNQMLLSQRLPDQELAANLRSLPWYVELTANWFKWNNIAAVVDQKRRRLEVRIEKMKAKSARKA
jgi:hypothetical protein